MSVNSFSSAAAGSPLDNVDSRLVSVMSSTGSYTYNKSLTPGIYLGKCKSLSGAVAPAAAFIKGGTSSNFTSIDSAGTLFNVSSTESSVSMEAYTNGFSSTATTSRNLNALPFDGTHGNNSNGFDIHLYNPTSGIYVGGYCASATTYSAYPSKFSSDLVTWTDISIPTLNGIAASARTFNKISWVNGLYVYTYLSGTGMKVATSTDLSTWTYKGAVNTDGYSSMNDVIYFNSKYYLAISTGVYSSTDLITWTKVYTGPSYEGTLVTNGTSIVFVMVDVAAYSANGTSWTTYAVNTNGYGSYWRSGAAIPSGKYLFITDTGQRLICNADGTKALQSTNDGNNIYYYPSDTGGPTFPNRIAVYGSTFYVVSRYDTGSNGRNQAIYTFDGTSVNGTYFRDLVSQTRLSGSTQRVVRSIYTLDGTNFVYTMRIVDGAATRTRTTILKSVDTQNSQVLLGSIVSVEAYPYSKGPVTILFLPSENFIEYSLDYGVTWYARPVVYSNKLNNGTIYSFTPYIVNSILLKKNGQIVFCTFNSADSTFKFTTFSKTGSKITEAPVKEVQPPNTAFANNFTYQVFFLKDEEYMFPISNMSIAYTLNGGTTWTTVAYSTSNSINSVPGAAAYSERDGAYYVQGGGDYSTFNAPLRKSTDLVTWYSSSINFTTTSTATAAIYGPFQLIFSGSKAMCLNFNGSTIAITDLSSSKQDSVPITISAGYTSVIVQDLDGLFYLPGIYDTDGGVLYSSDGINWLRKYDTNPGTSVRMNGYRNGKITYIDSSWNEVSVPRIKSTNAIFELYKTTYTIV